MTTAIYITIPLILAVIAIILFRRWWQLRKGITVYELHAEAPYKLEPAPKEGRK